MGWVNGTYEIDARDLDALEWASAVHRARDIAAYEAAAPIREADHARTLLFLALGDCGLDSDAAWAWGEACGREMLDGVDVDAAYAEHRRVWGLLDYGRTPVVAAGPMPAVHCHGDCIPCFCAGETDDEGLEGARPIPVYGPFKYGCEGGNHLFDMPAHVGNVCVCGQTQWTKEDWRAYGGW